MKVLKILSVLVVSVVCLCQFSMAEEGEINEFYCTPPHSHGGNDVDYIIMVDKDLYEFESIKAKLGRYTDSNGVKYDGYIDDAERDPEIHRCKLVTVKSSTTTPEEIKEYIKDSYLGSNGATIGVNKVFMIGAIPYARYEKYTEVWNTTWYYHAFASDLFYMDMDGVWKDEYRRVKAGETDKDGETAKKDKKEKISNGNYDSHTGDKAAEVVVSRAYLKNGFTIARNNASLSGANIVSDYFDRIRNYRRKTGIFTGFGPTQYSLGYRSNKRVQELKNYPDMYKKGDIGLASYGFDRILVEGKKNDNAKKFQEALSAKSYEGCNVGAHGSKKYQQFYEPAPTADNRFIAGMLPKGGSGALFYTISSCNTGDLNIAGMSLAVAYLYESERTLGVIANSSATYEPPYYHYYKDIGSPHYLSTGDAFRNFTKSTDYGWNSDHREKIMLFGDPLLKLQRNELWTATPATRVAGWYVASANAKAGEYVVLIGKFNEKDYCPVAFMLGAQDNISGEDYVVCNTIAYGELGDIAIDKFNRVRGRDYPAGHSPFAGDYAVVRIPSNIPPGKYYITARTNGKYTCMKEITVL